TNSIKTPPTYPFQFHIQFSKTKIPAAPEPPKEARRVGKRFLAKGRHFCQRLFLRNFIFFAKARKNRYFPSKILMFLLIIFVRSFDNSPARHAK
ncbi:hypothetical protein, partial [Gluconobacter wancherniae]